MSVLNSSQISPVLASPNLLNDRDSESKKQENQSEKKVSTPRMFDPSPKPSPRENIDDQREDSNRAYEKVRKSKADRKRLSDSSNVENKSEELQPKVKYAHTEPIEEDKVSEDDYNINEY
jgi:hypothetical protein